jgi:pimeloyl-ACP methyl ester carboxylesterase
MPELYWTKAGQQRVLGRYAALLHDCQIPNEQRRVSTCMGETFVLSCGPARAPPLILLHGGNTNSLMWLRSLEAWSQRHHVHAIDTIGDPGFSDSVRPDFATDAHARWLDDVWRALGVTRAAVVGASLGGWIALDYATRRPDGIERLALLAPAGIVRMDLGSQLKVAGLMLLGARGRRKALEISFGLDNDMTHPASLDAANREFLQFQGLVQTGFLSRIRLPAVIPDAALRSIDVPMLVVLGDRDIFFRADRMQQRVAVCLPRAQVHCLKNMGHGLGNPTELVAGFLAS